MAELRSTVDAKLKEMTDKVRDGGTSPEKSDCQAAIVTFIRVQIPSSAMVFEHLQTFVPRRRSYFAFLMTLQGRVSV